MARRVHVRFEQAVYGSFPFWDRGYAMLAHSAGCRPVWLTAFRTACQQFGERPAGPAEAESPFARRLERGRWMIVGVGAQGRDDQGRPGALAFHGLFVSARDYRRAGSSPLPFAPALRNDWTAETQTLDAGVVTVEPFHDAPERLARGPLPSKTTGILTVAGVTAFLLGAAVALALRPGTTSDAGPEPAVQAPAPDRPPPARADYQDDRPAGADDRRAVAESLVDLAERSGVLGAGAVDTNDPAALMALIAARLRYRGPWLAADDVAGLPAGDQARARAWDARVRQFAADRPLPADFAGGPLRWQLDTFAWSFHVEASRDRGRTPAERVHALADALAIDVALNATPGVERSPALSGYRAFLGRLPRR